MYRCPTSSSHRCDENVEFFREVLHCERFSTDATGPWFMLSDGMTESKCGEASGIFHLTNARLKPDYLTSYMIKDVEHARHRMDLIMRKKGKQSGELYLRACITLDFELIF